MVMTLFVIMNLRPYKCKTLSKGHYKIADIVYNFIFNLLLTYLNLSFSKMLNINKIQ